MTKLEELMEELAIGAEELANCVGIDEQKVDQYVKQPNTIPAKIARQIEQMFSKPKYWLDDDKDAQGINHDLFG